VFGDTVAYCYLYHCDVNMLISRTAVVTFSESTGLHRSIWMPCQFQVSTVSVVVC